MARTERGYNKHEGSRKRISKYDLRKIRKQERKARQKGQKVR